MEFKNGSGILPYFTFVSFHATAGAVNCIMYDDAMRLILLNLNCFGIQKSQGERRETKRAVKIIYSIFLSRMKYAINSSFRRNDLEINPLLFLWKGEGGRSGVVTSLRSIIVEGQL